MTVHHRQKFTYEIIKANPSHNHIAIRTVACLCGMAGMYAIQQDNIGTGVICETEDEAKRMCKHLQDAYSYGWEAGFANID